MVAAAVISGTGGADYAGRITLVSSGQPSWLPLVASCLDTTSASVAVLLPWTISFAHVLLRKDSAYDSDYCKLDDHKLQLFTSSLYFVAMAATLAAAYITRRHGRVRTILLAGIFFVLGFIFNCAAVHVVMLIIGRMLLGVGAGFANQAVPLYLSEVAPARWRGAMNIGFQLSVTIGILAANLVNYGTQKHPSLGLASLARPRRSACNGHHAGGLHPGRHTQQHS